MGWIRDRMEQCEPRLGSFSELAKKVCKARAWPREEKLKATSLATYLGKLDEGEELERFEQSPGMLEALGEVLGITDEELEEQLAPLRAAQAEQIPRLKLHDMPVRTIELQKEPPPPGIPREVLNPEAWPLWWHAPSGSGRTWAGMWLAARRQATFLQAPTWADAERKFPSQGTVFVELGSAEGVPLQDRWAPGLRICVATEAYPPQLAPPPDDASDEKRQRVAATDTWRLIESPPVGQWLRPLLEWLKDRATGKLFDPAACLKWLHRTGVIARGDSLGTVLGLIGVFATYAREPGAAGPLAKSQNLADIARLFVRMRSQQIEDLSLSPDIVWERLCTLGRRLLLEKGGSWREVRPLDDWRSLVPSRPDGSDLEWLDQLGVAIDRKALDKARQRLPPDAVRTVRALRDLGLLREREPHLYAFRPTWVLEGVIEQAVRATIENEAPETWGTILLREDWAAVGMRHLLDCFRRGKFHIAEKVVAAPDTSSPAWAAALEACFRVLGLAVLEELPVPEALILEVLRLQRRLLVPDSYGAPQPRFAYPYGLAQEHKLLGEEVWYTALLVLTESLSPQHELALESWSQGIRAENLKWMVDMVTMSHGSKEKLAVAWRMPLLLLGGRLLDRMALPPEQQLWPLLFRPERMLRLLQQDQFSMADIEQLIPYGGLASELPEYAKRRGVEWSDLASKVWTSWLGTAPSTLPNFLIPRDNEDSAIFWRHLPPEAVTLFIQRPLRWVFAEKEIYAFFQVGHWNAFTQAWISIKEPRWGGDVPHAAFHAIPHEHVRQALRAGFPDGWDHETRQTLWRRMPEVFCEEIDALFKQGQWEHALRQAWEVPPSLFTKVLSSAETALNQAEAKPPLALSLWLRAEIRSRAPGWERAWMMLERVVPTASR